MREAIALAAESARNGGGPFGAVVVRDGRIIGRGTNSVTLHNDPTAHAEMMAIRAACVADGTFKLDGSDLYSSCEPCPMCLGAAFWTGIRHIYYGADRHDATTAGFSDSHIYDQLALPPHSRTMPATCLLHDEAQLPFDIWRENSDKIEY